MGYGGDRMRVRAVRASEGAKVAPVVLESDDGNTIIWVVDQDAQPQHDASPVKPRKGQQDDAQDELDLEDAPKDEPAGKDPRPKGGEL